MSLKRNSGIFWSEEEDKQLDKLYNNDKLNILEISDKHGRTQGAIISRLLKNKYITNRQQARGYFDYRNSETYKSIVSNREIKKNYTTDNLMICVNKNSLDKVQTDIENINKELVSMKTTIQELVDMIKAIYEFETQ